MAKLNAELLISGLPGTVSAYRMRGTDKIVIRCKNGLSKNRIKKDPRFANTRRNNREFGGRATAAGYIRRVMQPLQVVEDHSITGALNPLLKEVQLLDKESEWGQRAVLISWYPGILEGFDLNRKTGFDSIVGNPVHASLSKDTLQAKLQIPMLIPGINFFSPGNFSVYRITAVLGVIPDFFYNTSYDRYHPSKGFDRLWTEASTTDWYAVAKPAVQNRERSMQSYAFSWNWFWQYRQRWPPGTN